MLVNELLESKYGKEYVDRTITWFYNTILSDRHDGAILHTVITNLTAFAKLPPEQLKKIFEPAKEKLIPYLFKNWTNGEPHRTEYDLFMLIHGVYLLKRDANIDWPELNKLLESLKIPIIKTLLGLINQTEFGRAINYVMMLKDIGFKWSELDILKKSLNHEAPPDRQLAEAIPDYYANSNIAKHLNALSDMLYAYDSDEAETTPHYADIAELESAIPWCLAMIGLSSSTVPNRIHMIQPHKQTLITLMLKVIKDSSEFDESSIGSTDGLTAMVKGAQRLGAKWPELDVIEKSLTHDRTKNDISEARDPFAAAVRREEREYHLGSVLRSLKQEIIAKDYEGINADFLELWKYPKYVFERANLYNLLAPLKVGMIKEILTYISSGDIHEAAHAVPLWVKACRKCGFDWPELDVIEKSAAAGLVPKTKKLRESLNPEQKKNIYKEVQKELGEGNLMRCLYLLTTRKIDFKDLPELKQLFDNDKKGCMYRLDSSYGLDMYMKVVSAIRMLTEIGVDWPELPIFMEERKGNTIRNLFHYMKNNQPGTVITLVNELQDAGIDWPELNVIRNSVEHELSNYKKA